MYGEQITWSGPLFDSFKVHGNTIELSFRHTDGGLVAKGGDLQGFEIAGPGRQWRTASARIVDDKVLVTGQDVEQPIAVRYSWADNPHGNLKNGADLPASPFRTDGD